jgi:small conductance mechanosensitive channel
MKLYAALLAGVFSLAVSLPSPGQEAAPQEQALAELGEAVDVQLGELRALTDRIEALGDAAPAGEREALYYRRDQRSFQVLEDVDQLARDASQLPVDNPQRQAVEQRFATQLVGLEGAIFTRVQALSQVIARLRAELRDMTGGQRVAREAYVHSLEQLRFRYYQALSQVIESHAGLGVDMTHWQTLLRSELYLYAETLAGWLEYSGGARAEIARRVELKPDDTDLQTVLHEVDTQHEDTVRKLDAAVLLLEQLQVDVSPYKAVLLQQSARLSLDLYDTAVVVSLVRDSLQSLRESVANNAPDFILRVLLFLAVLLIFRSLARLTRRGVGAALDRSTLDISTLLRDILVSVSGGSVMVVGIMMALSQVGISLAPMLAGLGVAGFIVGFALQDTLGNFAAGAMILIYRPYDVDDFVEVAGASGLVKKMNLVSTTIATFDNQTLVVPNSKIWGDVIKNVTAQKVRRVDLEFGVGYSDDVERVEQVLRDVVESHEAVLRSPEPTIKLHSLGDSAVNFIVRPWTRTTDYWSVYWDLTREIKLRFDREGISIPFPQRDMHIYRVDGPPPAE